MTTTATPSRKYTPRRLTKQSKAFYSVGDMCRMIRETNGLSILAVARGIHSSQSVIKKIEHGYVRDVSMKKLVDYLDFIGAFICVLPYMPPAGVDLNTQAVNMTVTGTNQTLSNFVKRDGDVDVSDDWKAE